MKLIKQGKRHRLDFDDKELLELVEYFRENGMHKDIVEYCDKKLKPPAPILINMNPQEICILGDTDLKKLKELASKELNLVWKNHKASSVIEIVLNKIEEVKANGN